MKREATSVFITGASSGLGEALALDFAREGITLGLAARRFSKLNSLKTKVEARGAVAHIYELDVGDSAAVTRAADSFVKRAGQVGLVVANAGTMVGPGSGLFSSDRLGNVIITNVNGVIYTMNAFVPHMITQGGGHIAAVSSVAAFRPLTTGSYSASKIAVSYMVDSFRSLYRHHGISFSTLFPGFVDTPMVKNVLSTPFMIDAEKAARLMRNAMRKRRRNYIFPWPWLFIVPLMKLLPDAIYDRIRKARKAH